MTLENTEITTFDGTADKPDRPLWRSIGRGLLCRCPNCGKGQVFRGYLTTVDRCAECKEELFHQRADDLPPYITVFVVGHIVVALYMATEEMTTLSLAALLAIWLPLTLVMTLAMLRPVKGGTIGMQWAMRMHGFSGNPDDTDH
ncbi:hypothetical protein Sa4125_20180 [Aureimonas sp. SA4125]|uniref:DUF983 domain-containing protein n=1 Tax=Aureimonas sp. SA4125 TaxID=2826993 RepID=UPI001CC72BED|nr:DUF983 domain-containing protein [Aureimonas sp. SA4125]BDA84476.1 hypothetical protein Sa4125_20180 [Aureimonas sp. SA4125]